MNTVCKVVFIICFILFYSSACEDAKNNSNPWQVHLLQVANSQLPESQAKKALKIAASELIMAEFRALPWKRKHEIAEVALALKEPILLQQLQSEVAKAPDPRILEEVEWKQIWERYMLDHKPSAEEKSNLYLQLKRLPGAPGQYVAPSRKETIMLNRLFDKAKRFGVKSEDLIKVLPHASIHFKYELARRIAYKADTKFLPWVSLLLYDDDELIARQAIVAIGCMQSLAAWKRLARFAADSNVPSPRRVFAAAVIIASINASKSKSGVSIGVEEK